MTLNICLTTEHAVYLSGDFRLSYKRGPKYPFEDDFNAQKLIPIVKYGWCGLVSFCGVAQLPNGLPVGDWIVEQVGHGTLEGSIDEVRGRLSQAGAWLAAIPGNNGFSMVLAGFKGRRPFVCLLSNIQALDGRVWNPPSKQLHISWARPKSVQLRCFGDQQAARALDSGPIEEMVKKAPHQNLMPDIAELNAKASIAPPGARSTISKECVVGWALPTGAIQITPFVHRLPGYIPGFVHAAFRQMGVTELTLKRGPDGTPLQPTWTGASYKNGSENGIDSMVGSLALGNVEGPIIGNPPAGMMVGWKIAGENESPITVNFGPREDGKRESVRRRK